MKLNIKIIETDAQIKQEILKALAPEVDSVLRRSVPSIRNRFLNMIRSSLIKEPEYSSLTSGQLKYELGISESRYVDSIIDAVIGTVQIKSNKVIAATNGLKGGLTVTVLSGQDVEGLIKTDIASVFDDKGYYLPWLEWLLLKGTSPLVKRFEVKIGPNPRSRTGNAIMVTSSTNWSIPSAFAGTETNNWFTRAMDTIGDNDMQAMIQQEIEKYI